MDLWGNEDADEYRLRRREEIVGGGVSYRDYDAMKEALAHCRRCPLREEGGRGTVLSTGMTESPLMIVGEGPGRVEDEYGVPLVGPSGELLDKALLSLGISRDRVYVTNVIRCRPRGNRTPTMDEGSFCGNLWLKEEIRLLAPKVIVALGKVALRFFLKEETGIVKWRGHWLSYENIPVMPTFHPAYLLRQTGHALVEAKWQVYYDLKAAKEKAGALDPTWTWKSETVPNLKEMYEAQKEKRNRSI